MKKRNKLGLIVLLSLTLVLLMATGVLAEDSTVIADPGTRSLDNIGATVATIVNFIRYIGATVLLGYVYWHTFGLAGSGKNSQKRMANIEALMWTGLAIFIFFAGGALAGVLKGLGSNI